MAGLGHLVYAAAGRGRRSRGVWFRKREQGRCGAGDFESLVHSISEIEAAKPGVNIPQTGQCGTHSVFRKL